MHKLACLSNKKWEGNSLHHSWQQSLSNKLKLGFVTRYPFIINTYQFEPCQTIFLYKTYDKASYNKKNYKS